MNTQTYYKRVVDRLKNCYQFSHYVIAAGHELVAEGLDPIFPAIAEPVDQLEKLTLQRGLQVHIPVIGEKSQSVLMPLDFEIFLTNQNQKLYEDRETNRKLFNQIIPVIRFLENLFQSRGIPYLLDYTPSGGHILFQNLHFPNPSALEPRKLQGFIYDFLIHAHWKPKHIANVLRDIYQKPAFNWTQDFIKYPAEEKANFWTRTYSAVALWQTGRLNV